MNLEDIEQKVFNYLKQVSNPLVSIDSLVARLKQEGVEGITRPDLIDFLKHHELFRVIEPQELPAEAPDAEGIAELASIMGPCVILDTRIPTEQQTAEMMHEQLALLRQALITALAQSREDGDEERATRIKAALQRAETIQNRLQAHRES